MDIPVQTGLHRLFSIHEQAVQTLDADTETPAEQDDSGMNRHQPLQTEDPDLFKFDTRYPKPVQTALTPVQNPCIKGGLAESLTNLSAWSW
jgi:hypothetical protein